MPKARSSRRRALTDEERAEKRAAERELMAKAIEELRSSEGWKRWLSVRRHFHSYSLHNQLLISGQCPEATRVAGFRSWLDLGYAVRKGERSIRIWAPCPPSKKKLEQWRKEGADPETKPRTFFRLVPVFDRSQVDPLPEFPGGPVNLEPPPSQPIAGDGLAHLLEPLGRFAASIGYAFEVKAIPGGAQGKCDRGERRIAVEEAGGDFSPNAQIAVGVHELAHALVLVDRQEGDPKLRYGQEEVVVECVAYTVCASLGLDISGSSVPYMTGWSKGDEVERYVDLIDRLARRLEDALLDADQEPEGKGAERASVPDVPIAA
jgi:antirestriction protein ArdC